MPHINRIRVNNVKYNFGTQYYDDFLMRFSCRNTIYDLANGGGKSVLMLLLLQNMIPNCTLDEKQPIEKLFRTGEGSTTIHSLIEWELSEAHRRDGFRYMTTGFCARKAKDGEEEEISEQSGSASIQYFNYCIFYRKYNDNDIKNLPLEKNGEKITYHGLKNQLKELAQKDMSLEVHIFERKGDYQRFIADYGIYESEWEIIRGINKTEGHVRTYFESNYKTTRKVVEDLLIEEIIEKSFHNKYADEESRDVLAQTLLGIKDKLLELSQKKEEINHYDRQVTMINGFVERLHSMRSMYADMDETFSMILRLYNTVRRMEREAKTDILGAADRRQELVKEKNELSMKVETARILVDMEKLEKLSSELNVLDLNYAKLTEELDKVKEELAEGSCGNYFLEAQQYGKEYEKLRQVILNLQENHGERIEKIKRLVKMKKSDNLRKYAEYEKRLSDLSEEMRSGKLRIEDLTGQIRSLDNQLAIKEYRIKNLSGHMEASLEKLNQIRKNYNVLLATDAPAMKQANENEIQKAEFEILECEKQISQLRQKMIDDKLESVKLRMLLASKQEESRKLKEELESRQGQNDKVKTICQVYGENNLWKLSDKIIDAYRSGMTECIRIKEELSRVSEELIEVQSGHIFATDKRVKTVLEYINRYHNARAVAGTDYLAGCSLEQAAEIIDAVPFIANMIIVYEHFDQVTFDAKMPELLESGETVALVQIDTFESMIKNTVYQSEVVYVTGSSQYVKGDLDKLEDKLKIRRETLQADLDRRMENAGIMLEDLQVILAKTEKDGICEMCSEEDVLACEAQVRHLESQWDVYMEGKNKQERDLRHLEEELEHLRGILKEKEAESKNLDIWMHELAEYEKYESELRKETDSKEQLMAEYEEKSRALSVSEEECRKWKEEHAAVTDAYVSLKQKWAALYAKYDEAEDDVFTHHTKNAADSAWTEAMEVNLEAMVDSLSQESANVADKERLMKNYKESQERALARIAKYGRDVEYFRERARTGNLHEMTAELEQERTGRQKSLAKQMNECEKERMDMRSKRDCLQGQVGHAVTQIVAKYGYFDKELVSRQQIHIFLEENDALLAAIETKMETESRKLKSLEETMGISQMLIRDLEKLMSRGTLKESGAAGEVMPGADVKLETQKVSERFDAFVEEKIQWTKDFERELGMLVDMLSKLQADDLALEIRSNIQMPSNVEETDEIIATFTETVELIELEKERVVRGLEDMQVIKENFENQCIQSCMNIRTELERLDKLSVITMEDEQIPIMKLRIPYVDEEQYRDRMSEYIDNIAAMTDSYDSNEEKLKYLRNNLCWKKLFSVIVTDMNGIRLNLYKRERIAGQSRYLPYEEAVGSTGQSQGIYIQFLISIINYISSINSKSSDATRLKKTIFIDNPFGAAKDIYIWEPIFKLLKTNNVQLIVPARGATPAITGRFDVNYILGQKMCNGKQQTVVVDYYSNVENDSLEYTTLSYEQTSLF